MKKSVTELVLKKPNQTIMISNGNITATQRKAYNVLLYKASDELRTDASKSEFFIAIADIKRMAGIKATDNWHLKKDIKSLKNIDIEIIKDNGDWVMFNLLSQAEKEGDFLLYDLPKIIRDALIQNDYYTALDMMIIKTLTSKYSVIIYEIAMRYNKVEIPKFEIDEFKKLTGTEKYKNFKDIRKRVIEPAIEEINEKSDMEISYKTFAAGRRVKEIKFKIERKDQIIIDEPITEITDDRLTALESELISLKLSKKNAQNFVKKYPEDQIRRNIDLTLKKAEDGEVRKIPGFLTDSIKEDYAKDYKPVDEKHQGLVSEAKKCRQKTRNTCQAVWNNYKNNKTHACHWCKKFAAQRKNAESEVAEKSPVSSETNPEPIFNLIPVKITKPIRSIVTEYSKAKGSEYVKRNIEHTNQIVKDKRKYRALLEKSLDENQAGSKKETEKRVKKDIHRLDLHKKLKKELKAMPAERIEELRKGCMKNATPFVRKRLEKMPVSKLVSNPSFLDYCALAVVN